MTFKESLMITLYQAATVALVTTVVYQTLKINKWLDEH